MTGLIKPFGKGKSNFVHPDEARRRLEEIVVEESRGDTQPASERKKAKLTILSPGAYYEIVGIPLAGPDQNVVIQKDLLDGSRAHTLDEWKELSDRTSPLRIPSLVMYSAVVQALHDNSEGNSPQQTELNESVTRILKEDFERGVMTSTILIHFGQNHDEVIHDYFKASHRGAKPPRNSEFVFFPMNRVFDDMPAEEAKILTGSSHPTDLRKAYKFVSGKHSYVETDRDLRDPVLRPIIAVTGEHLELTSKGTIYQRRCARAIYFSPYNKMSI